MPTAIRVTMIVRTVYGSMPINARSSAVAIVAAVVCDTTRAGGV